MKSGVCAIVLMTMMITVIVPVSFSDAETDEGFPGFYDQLGPDSKIVYDSLVALKPSDFVEFDEKHIYATISNVPVPLSAKVIDSDEQAKDSIMYSVQCMLMDALTVMRMQEPMALCTWGNVMNFDVSGTTDTPGIKCRIDYQFEDTSHGRVCIATMDIDVIMDEYYSKDLQGKYDAVVAYIDGYKFGSTNPRSIIGKINSDLCKRLSYDPKYGTDDQDPYCHDIYCLVSDSKRAVCDGYSKAFLALCQKAGIECYVILGYSVPYNDPSDNGHAWNVVKLTKNGKDAWYPVDVTWNDSNSNEYLLIGSSFQKTHQAGLYQKVGFIYPVLNETKYDDDPWYTEDWVEKVFIILFSLVLCLGVGAFILQEKKKNRA